MINIKHFITSALFGGIAGLLPNHAAAYLVFPGDRYNVIYAESIEIDPNIQYQPHDTNVVYDCTPQGCAQPGYLFVMLPSAGATGTSYQKILATMAEQGIRGIALNYENNDQIFAVCGSNDACYEESRRDKTVGTANSPYVTSYADGIVNRLSTALRQLGWNDMFDPATEALLTERIILAGDGQGAGMAAWIGKHVTLARVCQFAGTWDHISPGASDAPTLSNWVPATWLSQPSMTPASRFYGFAYRNDVIENSIDFLAQNWGALGMGSFRSLSRAPQSQMVIADEARDICEVDGQSRHQCAVNDASTPMLADGITPEYKAAWLWVCAHDLPAISAP